MTDVVDLLISKYKFDVNCRSVNNWTPVYVASLHGHLDIVKYLYNTGMCDYLLRLSLVILHCIQHIIGDIM